MRVSLILVLFLLFSFINISNAAPSRIITLVNQCGFPVWFGFASGSAQKSCKVDTDCPAGAVCANTNCFWKNPQPADGNYQLDPKGGTKQIFIPVTNVKSDAVVWSGAVAGRTGCKSDGSCETAGCGKDSSSGPTVVGGCKTSVGFDQPATEAEFTFTNTYDTYDIEMINGYSIPIKMAPDAMPWKSDNPYVCGIPGDEKPQGQFGACTWNFQPPSPSDYQWVTAGGKSCNTNADCTIGICGFSKNPGHAPLYAKSCGTLLGYFTANQICGVNTEQGAPFNCQMIINNQKLRDLYLCIASAPTSCYADDAKNNCCGCVDWNTKVPTYGTPYTASCNKINPTWTANVLTTLLWLKQACPTAYVYPFDDQSSTFTCRNIQNNLNSINYTITFCPNAGIKKN